MRNRDFPKLDRPLRLCASLLLAAVLNCAAGGIVLADTAGVPSSTTAATVVDPEALLRLGDLSYNGNVVATDYAKAFDYYSQAAAAGSLTGKLRMGEMMARGLGTTRDVDAGRALVKEVADTGSASALVSVGDLYSRGDSGPMDPVIASKAYDKAASLGNGTAMVRMGDMLLYARFARANPKKALDYYRRAVEAGNPYGLYGVGKIYIDGLVRKAGSFKEGVQTLLDAEKAGVPDAVTVISNSYFYTYRGRGGAKLALATLEEAMQRGNMKAARELVSAYRTGKRNGRLSLVRRDPAKAMAYLDQIRSKLTPGEIAYEEFLFDALKARRSDYPKLADRLATIPTAERQVLVRDLRGEVPRLFIYVGQAKLAELGYYKGRPDGSMGGRTLRAFRQYCSDVGTRYFCRLGPMSGPMAEILSYRF
jgi:TPR repeat protein